MLTRLGQGPEVRSLDSKVRATLVALLAAILVALGAVAPAAALTRVPKVAVIVGPVGALTSSYRALANDAAAAARNAGAQVVKVYSPDATWPAVRKAITGASIVIYLGHGNGWPSRYRNELFPASQNGFGLNPVAGVDDSAHQYFGEASVDDVRLAPNAVVLLHHLCYASGNTEPGLAEGTVSQAVQRVDNYAAGFLRAGARAVVAEGHLGPAYYVRALLTTKLSIEKIWNRSPNANGNTFRVASKRTPGYAARLDPDSSSGGYYRSLVSRGVTAGDLRASAVGSTNPGNPAPPAEPSLTNLALRFGDLSLATLPIASTKTTLSLPLAAGSPDRIPAGAQVGLRWDPVLLDAPLETTPSASSGPSASAGPSPAAGPSGSPDPGASADPSGSPDPGASADPSGSPDPSVAPSESPSAAPSASPSRPPEATPAVGATPSPARPRGLFTLPTAASTPAATAAPSREDPPQVVVPTEAPAVDLIAPERVGTVVSLAPAKRGAGGLSVGTAYPTVPGLYRLVPTLHTPSGVAYDAATQGLLTPVLVRVGGPVAVAYGAPASLTLPALAVALLPVRVVNAGSEPWDQYVTTLPGSAEENLPNGRLTHVPATLTATWISATGLAVPVASSATLDPTLSGPGMDLAVTLGLEAPVAPGEYLLLLDVVSPAQGPLSALGSAPAVVRVTVTAPVPTPAPIPPRREG